MYNYNALARITWPIYMCVCEVLFAYWYGRYLYVTIFFLSLIPFFSALLFRLTASVLRYALLWSLTLCICFGKCMLCCLYYHLLPDCKALVLLVILLVSFFFFFFLFFYIRMYSTLYRCGYTYNIARISDRCVTLSYRERNRNFKFTRSICFINKASDLKRVKQFVYWNRHL